MERTRMKQKRNERGNSKENLKPSYSCKLLPCLKKQGNKLFSKTGNNLLTNQQNYDTDELKNQLNTCKSRIYMQNYKLLSLKIKYGKLYSENTANKNIISNILGVPLNKNLTKDEFINKIENAKLNKYNREILKEAFDSIILRAQLKEKKELNTDKENFLKELEENSKTKRLNELLKEFTEKCEEQRNLLRILKALKQKNCLFGNDIKNMNNIIEKENDKKKVIMKEKEEKKNIYDEFIIELNDIKIENKNLDERIKRLKLTNREKEEKNIQIEIGINYIKEEKNELELYKKEREIKLKQLDDKKDIVEELRKERNEQEMNIKQLNQEKDNLDIKLNEYSLEKPKLIKKSKEPKSDIEKLKNFEKYLEELKIKKIKINNIHEGKKKKLNDKKEEVKKESEKNKAILEKNNSIKSEMYKKIKDLRNKNLILMETVNNELARKNIEYKNEIDKYQYEINDFDKELQNYTNIEEDLNNAESKLKKMMNRKEK
jgi:hypothetical protein